MEIIQKKKTSLHSKSDKPRMTLAAAQTIIAELSLTFAKVFDKYNGLNDKPYSLNMEKTVQEFKQFRVDMENKVTRWINQAAIHHACIQNRYQGGGKTSAPIKTSNCARHAVEQYYKKLHRYCVKYSLHNIWAEFITTETYNKYAQQYQLELKNRFGESLVRTRRIYKPYIRKTNKPYNDYRKKIKFQTSAGCVHVRAV